MPFWNNVKRSAAAFGRWFEQGAYAMAETPYPPFPSARDRVTHVTTERAMSLSTFYRGVKIHATAACQLPLNTERNGQPTETTHALVARPNIDMSRSAFIEYTVVSMYTDGNAFWHIVRSPSGEVINLEPLDPNEVTVNVTRDRFDNEVIEYGYRGEKYSARDIKHLQVMRVPGHARGLGPVQAATIEIRGALDARDYGAMWLNDQSVPDGVLTTDQELAPGVPGVKEKPSDSTRYKRVWYGRDAITGEPEENEFNANQRLRVLGKGLSYTPLALKPSDVQFLETQQFTTIQMARLVGAPASLMLVGVEGSSETYTNVEQEWIGYVRFELMKVLREIEEALSDLLPGVQKARFNVEALLRTDTKTRYESHALSLNPQTGWMSLEEVRSIEGLPPLTDVQRAEIEARATARKDTVNA